MKRENPKSIIIGLDHNLDFLKADRHSTTYDFIQNNLDFGLIPTITRPTRITNSTATLIDNIIVSQNLCWSYVSSILVNDTSDHLPTVCVLSSLMTAKRGPMVVKCRDTRVQNMNSLKKQLSDHDWTEELTDLSPSTNMEKIHTTLSSMINHCLPYIYIYHMVNTHTSPSNHNTRHKCQHPLNKPLIFVNCATVKAIMTTNANLQAILWHAHKKPLIKADHTVTKTLIMGNGHKVTVTTMTQMGNLFSSGGSRCR